MLPPALALVLLLELLGALAAPCSSVLIYLVGYYVTYLGWGCCVSVAAKRSPICEVQVVSPSRPQRSAWAWSLGALETRPSAPHPSPPVLVPSFCAHPLFPSSAHPRNICKSSTSFHQTPGPSGSSIPLPFAARYSSPSESQVRKGTRHDDGQSGHRLPGGTPQDIHYPYRGRLLTEMQVCLVLIAIAM